MRESIISFFNPPVSNTLPYGVYTIESIYRYITSDLSLKAVTEEVRNHLSNPEVFKKKKLSLLPFVTPAGVFKKRHREGLVLPSGDFVVDIDGLSSQEEAIRLRDLLAQDDRLQPDLVFVSPSTRGIKIFVPYTLHPDAHLETCFRQAIEASWLYLETMYELQVDRANIDFSRTCLLCHDADAKFFNSL